MQNNHNNYLHNSPAQLRGKLYMGIFIVNLILVVSFAGSIMYWYALSIMGVSDTVAGVWKLVLWTLVAVGAVTEIVKKVSLSTFRHKGIWLSATLVSVLTVMGTFSILDANRESTLVKQSDQYKNAQVRQKGALDTASQYGWAAGFDLASLEAQLQQVVDDRAKRRIKYASYLSQKKALEKKIEAKRAYDSAMSMNSFAGEAMAKGGTGASSSNPLLSNIAALTGVGAEFLKSVFYLLVTLLLEFAAFFFGGKVEELKNRLNMTRAQLLDLQNIEVFGVSVAQISNATYQNVLQAEHDQIEADKEVNQLRKKREIPAGATAEKVSEIRAMVSDNFDGAKGEYSSNGMGFLSEENRPQNKVKQNVLKKPVSSAASHHSSVLSSPCLNTDKSPCNNTDLRVNNTDKNKPKNGKAGEKINCPNCNNIFTRKTYNHRFCKSSCKDDYHNDGDEKRLSAKRANLRKLNKQGKPS